MSNIPAELKYQESHEWVREEGDGTLVIGITDHAQDQLGDVVFVELPEVGANLAAGDEMGVVESVKAASDIFAPVTGEVVAINPALEDSPELVNSDPYSEGWFIKMKPADAAELNGLLDASAYGDVCDADD